MPSSSPPTFSIVIAAWNAAHLIGDAVESALAQTLPPLEVVVCDDESEDDLSGALRPFGDRVTLVRIAHGGEGAAKNAAAQHATADFVAILDADDVYLPGRLEALAALARERPELDVLTTNAYLELEGRTVDTYYPTVTTWPSDEAQAAGIIEDSSGIFGAAAVRRSRYLEAGGFAVDMRIAADWELWMRLAIGGARFGLADEPLHRYRLQPGSLTADKAAEWRGCVDALERVRPLATTAGPEIRGAFERSLHTHREWAMLAEAERSLRTGSSDARSRARAVAFGPGFAARTRAKALLAAGAPGIAARLLDRRERRTGVSRGSRGACPRSCKRVGLPRILPLFVLPRLPGTARVLGGLDSWREGLEQAQVALVDGDDADLVVAPASMAREAAAVAPHGLILEGAPRAGSRLKREFSTSVWMVVPDRDAPEALLGGGKALINYAVAAGAGGRRARLARLARGSLAVTGIVGQPVVVASRDGSVPALLEGAAAVEPEVAGSSFLPILGSWGDPFSRGVLLLFPRGASLPRWALKFARVPGNERPFELDERALALAAAAGGTVAAHAPRLIGRFTVDRLSASLETASIGRRLLPVLTGSLAREKKLALIERIAGWTEAVARETTGRVGALDPRFVQEALAHPTEHGTPPALTEALERLPSVFMHGDLWPDNVLVEGESFGLIDWEAAKADGMPLWDLHYFLSAALAFVDGASSESEKEEHFVRLHRGELASSRLFFDWTRRVAEATGLAPEAVGPLATLRVLWLASEDSGHARKTAAAGSDFGVPLSVRHAERWLADPALGSGWDRWRS